MMIAKAASRMAAIMRFGGSLISTNPAMVTDTMAKIAGVPNKRFRVEGEIISIIVHLE